MSSVRERVALALGRPSSDAARRTLEVEDAVRRATRGTGPILVGPWRGDVGYELLYWIPFLRGLVARRPELRSRLIAISRGGVASWYEGVADRYIDAFDLMELDEMRSLADRNGAVVGYKPTSEVTALDRELRLRAARTVDGVEPNVLPAELTSVLMRLTKADDPSPGYAQLRFAPIAPPNGVLDGVDLPERFVAVRFYGNSPLPSTSDVRDAVDDIVESLAESIPVVDLGNELELDHHRNLRSRAIDGVVTLAGVAEPRTNLALQTAVMARSDAFFGTYGGLSYLAAHVGVRAVAFYSSPEKVNPVYLQLGHYAAAALGQNYVALDLASRGLCDVVAATSGHGVGSARQ